MPIQFATGGRSSRSQLTERPPLPATPASRRGSPPLAPTSHDVSCRLTMQLPVAWDVLDRGGLADSGALGVMLLDSPSRWLSDRHEGGAVVLSSTQQSNPPSD